MIQRQLGLLGALLVLFVAVVSKIPTSHCSCNHRKPQSQAPLKDGKSPCPFGQLRTLAASLNLDGDFDLVTESAAYFELTQSPFLLPTSSTTPRAFLARAPPLMS